MMTRRKTLGISIVVLILLMAGLAYALPPRVSWIPDDLKPDSIAPGQSMTYTLTLKHTGILPVLLANQLRVVAEGDIVPFVTITQPTFPPTFRRGNEVVVQVTVNVPTATPLSVKTGQLILARVFKNRVLEVWRAEELPVELTFSPFHLPSAPDKEEDAATIQGVDSDANGVPDRVDRWIGFEAPESEKKRMALTLSAEAQQDFFSDYLAHLGEDPNAENVRARVLAIDVARGKAANCLQYVFGAHVAFPEGREAFATYSKSRRELQALFMDTPERLRAFFASERPLVATGYPSIRDEQLKQECLDLGFNPDTLPN